MAAGSAKRDHALAIAAIIVVTFVAFLPALGAQFVSWDDNRNFVGNPDYRGLGLTQLRWMWSTTLMGHYIPVSWMTLGLDHALWGMDARGYHLTNLLLHCLAAVLLYLVALRLFRFAIPDADPVTLRVPIAAGVLIFAVHPLRVESVAWITERRDMLSLVFFLVSILFYLRAVERDSLGWRWYGLSLTAFCVALLSKATVVTLPLVLLVINVMPLGRLKLSEPWAPGARILYRELAPFFVLSAAAGLLSLRVLDPPPQLGLGDKIAVTAYSLRFYLEKTLLPFGLAPLYQLPARVDAWSGQFMISYLVVGLAAAALWTQRKRAPAVTTVIIAAAVILLPLLGIVQNGPQIAADRYTYHAAAAFSLLAALVLLRFPGRLPIGVAAAAVIALAGLTWRQCTFWIDSGRLWSRVLAVDSTSSIAHFAMADLRLAAGNAPAAREHYERGVALDPLYPEGHNNLGSLLMQQGHVDAAIARFRKAVALRHEYLDARLNLGAALSSAGHPELALGEFDAVLALRPDLPNAHFSRGNALVRLGRSQDALAEYEAELRVNPANARAREYRDHVLGMIAQPGRPPSRKGHH